jgi:hypothetical protein
VRQRDAGGFGSHGMGAGSSALVRPSAPPTPLESATPSEAVPLIEPRQ